MVYSASNSLFAVANFGPLANIIIFVLLQIIT